ncbi:MAG: hypothetical protein JXR07_14295 [Reichenbachiella sp.]
MKAATVSEIKRELKSKSEDDLLNLCLHLSKFKKENKELLTYLLYEAEDEANFIEGVKDEIDELFLLINTNSYFYIKKSVRKILRMIKKYIRYSKKKQTEVELLLHFCKVLKEMKPTMRNDIALHNIFKRQVEMIEKAVSYLHEDLQYDYDHDLRSLI